MCDCTQCRNLGNSMDVCCQCCQCQALANNQEHRPHGVKQQKHYKVRSVSLHGENDETLEVCIANEEADGDHADPNNDIDDMALAHRVAGGCQSCPPPPPVPCSSCPPACNDPNCTACAQKCPHFSEWSSQNQHLPPNHPHYMPGAHPHYQAVIRRNVHLLKHPKFNPRLNQGSVQGQNKTKKKVL